MRCENDSHNTTKISKLPLIFICNIRNMAWCDNFYIYLENLSTYYIVSLVLSFSAVIFSIYFHLNNTSNTMAPTIVDVVPEADADKLDLSDEPVVDADNIISKIKMIRQQTIVDKLTANLTEDQLQEEKEAESQQLTAILSLLKEQQEKFQVASMEELENQMKLYR